MVERHSSQIVFSQIEQTLFSLPERLSADEAVKTAVTFNEVAVGLYQQASNQEIIKPDARQRMINLNRRASQLGGIAARILDLCPDEHLAYLLEQDKS